MAEVRHCLYCGEPQDAVRSSQRSGDPIYCAGDFSYEYDEPGWVNPRHRFRDWTDGELEEMGVFPEYYGRYRRVTSQWGIRSEHRYEDTRPSPIVLYEDDEQWA